MKIHHQNGRALPYQAETQRITMLLRKAIILLLSHEAQT